MKAGRADRGPIGPVLGVGVFFQGRRPESKHPQSRPLKPSLSFRAQISNGSILNTERLLDPVNMSAEHACAGLAPGSWPSWRRSARRLPPRGELQGHLGGHAANPEPTARLTSPASTWPGRPHRLTQRTDGTLGGPPPREARPAVAISVSCSFSASRSPIWSPGRYFAEFRAGQ